MPALKIKLLGLPIEVRASFLLLIVLIGLPTHRTAELMLAWIGLAAVGVFVHELGHAAAFLAFGERPSITLHGAGGHTMASHPGLSRLIVVSAAGPAAGVLAGLLVLLAAPLPPTDPFARRLFEDALFVTFGLSAVNLIPVGQLDGAAVLRGLVTAATGAPAGVAGAVMAAIIVLLLAAVAVWAGRPELAITLVILVALMAIPFESVGQLFGRPAGAGSAAALLYQGRAEEALASAERDLDRHPKDVDTMLLRAAALRSMSRYAEAERGYDTVLQVSPGSAHALSGRFSVRRALGRFDDAQEDLEALLALPASDHADVAAQFYALYIDDQYQRALELVGHAAARLSLTGAQADQLRGLEAVLEDALGRPAAALAVAAQLVAKRSDDFTLHELCALSLLQLGRLDEARASANRALAGARRHPELIETLGIIERLSGNNERAYELLLAAATARPDLPRARAQLSACFAQLSRFEEAAAALDTLPAFAADEPYVLYARACLLAATGRPAEATVQLDSAAAIRPSLGAIARLDPLLKPTFAPSPTTGPLQAEARA